MTIPFANMSREDAEKEPFSPYAAFCNAMRDWYVFDRKTRQPFSKGELFIKYGGDKKKLKLVTNRTHPDLKFISKKDW